MTKISATVAAIQAVLAALVLLGILNLTDGQLAGIMVAINLAMIAAVSWFSPAVPWFGNSEGEG